MATGQVRTESELLELFKDNVTQDIYPIDIRDFVVTMFFEIAAVTGVSSYVYIGYADDASGTGFTISFNPTKEYIAIRSTTVEIPAPVVTDFTGLWTKYKGDQGDPGTSILTGLVDPLGADGSDGDVYLNTTTYDIFGPKSGGVWGSGTNLIGNGIASVSLINTVALVDTYRILFTDGSFFDYDVTNGADGADGVDGLPGPTQSGVNLGAGAILYAGNDGSDDLTFKSLTSSNPTNLQISETAAEVDFDFVWDDTGVSITNFLNGDFVSGVGLYFLQAYKIYDGRYVKISGGLKYVGIGIGVAVNARIFKLNGLTVFIGYTSGLAMHFDSTGAFIDYVPFKIEGNGDVRFLTNVIFSPNDYINFEPMIIRFG